MANLINAHAYRQQIIAAYLKGAKLEALGAQFGCCRHTCKRILLASGVKLRSRADGIRRNTFDERFFSSIDTEAKAYWLGFVSADGNVMNHDNRLAILLGRKDRAHLARFLSDINGRSPIYDGSYLRDGRRIPTSTIVFHSDKLLADLAVLGVGPRKSLTLCPWNGLEHLMRHYWRGVVDGDGCIHRRQNGYWSVSLVGSEAVVQGFADFVEQRLDHRGKKRPDGKIFSLHFGGTGLPQAIVALLYGESTVFLARKKRLADQLAKKKVTHPFGSRVDLSWLTGPVLQAMYRRLGTWNLVAEHLRIRRCNVLRIRDRLSIR